MWRLLTRCAVFRPAEPRSHRPCRRMPSASRFFTPTTLRLAFAAHGGGGPRLTGQALPAKHRPCCGSPAARGPPGQRLSTEDAGLSCQRDAELGVTP